MFSIFFLKVLTMSGSETKRTVTRLSFENHTACECVGRNSDLMPRTEPYISDARPHPHHPSASSSSSFPPLYDESNNNSVVEGKSSRHHENKKKSSSRSQTTKKGHGRHDDGFSSIPLGRVATVYSTDPTASRLLFQQRNEEEEEEEEDWTVAKRRFAGSSLVNPTENLNYSK